MRRQEHLSRTPYRDHRVFLEVNKPQPVVLFEVAKGWLTGQAPDIGEMHRIEAPVGGGRSGGGP